MDFPGSPVVKTLHFQWGGGIRSLVGELRICCMMQPKKELR